MPIVTDANALRLGKIIYELMNENLDSFVKRLIQALSYDPIETMHKLDELEKAVKKSDEFNIENILQYLENRQKNFR